MSLADRLGLHPRSARDFFDVLVALRMLDRHGDRYANTPETDLNQGTKESNVVFICS